MWYIFVILNYEEYREENENNIWYGKEIMVLFGGKCRILYLYYLGIY